jgi:hypothetical protein
MLLFLALLFPAALLSVLPIDFDRDGFAGYADCSPRDPLGYVRWCLDLDGDSDGRWTDGEACLPADAYPLDARLTLTCE